MDLKYLVLEISHAYGLLLSVCLISCELESYLLQVYIHGEK